jgi:hypothetical protein
VLTRIDSIEPLYSVQPFTNRRESGLNADNDIVKWFDSPVNFPEMHVRLRSCA